MPERVSKEERIVSLAIEKARKAKEELSAKQRKNIEPTQVLEIDTDPEVEKIKRPKVQDASKITNQTQKKEGYGLAGESLKKAVDPTDNRSKLNKQISSIKGIKTAVALELLDKAFKNDEGKLRLTSPQIKNIDKAFRELKSMDKETVITKLAVIDGLGLEMKEFYE